VKPDTFVAVMATGIVSIAALDHGFGVISDVLIVFAAVALPVLIAAAAIAWRRESWNVTDLDVALRLCSYIAAYAVVGARLAEHRIVLWVLASASRTVSGIAVTRRCLRSTTSTAASSRLRTVDPHRERLPLLSGTVTSTWSGAAETMPCHRAAARPHTRCARRNSSTLRRECARHR
jgi:hypothetical protein